MDVVQVFNDELQSLLEIKPPVSKAKMGLITRAAMKGVKFYKHIVQSVEKFIAKCRPEYKIPGLYVIDSIVRQSRHQFGVDRDVYAARFSRNLHVTFNNLFSGCPIEDKPKIVRVLNLWQKNGVFSSQTIQPLMDLANPNSNLTLASESTLSANSPSVESSKHAQTSKYVMHRFNNSNTVKAPSPNSKRQDGGLRFSKNMLDFDYDEDDDDDGDETPTEAEPPLSSTLNKLGIEQRSRNEMNSSLKSSHHQQINQHNSQTSNAPAQSNKAKGDQDLVLERWNRLIRQQSITGEGLSEQKSTNENRRNRSRSRSPVSHRDRPAAKGETSSTKDTNPAKPPQLRAAEREAVRAKKCLPEIRDKHLTVCSSTLWLGHVPKTISEADISDAFGEFGTINSIDLIPPRGCAYVCMDRRQDAKRALTESRDLKLNGSHIKMAWAPGKGFKEYKKLKDFWEADIGASYIPYSRIDSTIDFDVLEEGGVIDEDSMSMEMREMREQKAREREEQQTKGNQSAMNLPLPTLPLLTQPPPFAIPPPNLSIPPPNALGQGSMMNGIPFPPPGVTASRNQVPPPIAPPPKNMFEQQETHERDNIDRLNSPSSIEQQISMTERQINMVEQQLSMIQQAQSMSHPQGVMPQLHPHAVFAQNQLNPLLFDMPPPQLLQAGQPMMDPHSANQMPVFANPPVFIGQQPPMLPIGQDSVDPKMNGNTMPHFGGRF